MNKYILIIALVIGFSSYAQKPGEVNLNTSIQEAKVFSQGAQLTRTGKTTLTSGRSVLVIKSLSPFIDQNSIQVNGKGDFTILSVNHRLDYLAEQVKNEQVDSLQQIVNKLSKEIDTETSFVAVMDAKKKLLEENQKLGGTNSGISYDQLTKIVDYYMEEMMSIEKSKINSKIKLEELKKERTRIQNQINQINRGNELPSSEIVVNVESRSGTRAELEVSYFTQNAGWFPKYDIRVKDISSPIQLEYKAEVYQNTREDWKNVKLVLSNGNPNKSGIAPELYTWYLNFYQPEPRPVPYAKSMGAVSRSASEPVMLEESIVMDLEAELVDSATPTVNISQNQTTVEIEVKEKYSIDSNGEQLTVSLEQYDINSIYEYYAVPKLDNEAFLLAKIIDWEKYSLLPGQANLFLEGTYVGKSFLDTYSVSDTLEISLGRDPGIAIERTKIDLYTKSSFIGSNKVESRGFKISIRNPKSSAINLTLHDQIPVSTRDDITVTPQEISGGKLNKTTGEITWNLTIKPGEQRTLEMRYEVKYPKKERIILE
ncbi:MAG: DUF4139 domain-containing protein [Cyclobacteriaceae bacterium]|nr:DUF4139 domain-containing protein [Cyclobacteriaceae bacterium SS2]